MKKNQFCFRQKNSMLLWRLALLQGILITKLDATGFTVVVPIVTIRNYDDSYKCISGSRKSYDWGNKHRQLQPSQVSCLAKSHTNSLILCCQINVSHGLSLFGCLPENLNSSMYLAYLRYQGQR